MKADEAEVNHHACGAELHSAGHKYWQCAWNLESLLISDLCRHWNVAGYLGPGSGRALSKSVADFALYKFPALLW
jgi:hypothetical protein